MEDEKKKLDRWLRLGAVYAKAMPVLLTVIGVCLLIAGILGRQIHGFVALGAFVAGLAVAYFPRLIIWRIKRLYGEPQQPQLVFFQAPQQGQPDFETQLNAEMLKLSGRWPSSGVGRD